VHTCEDRARHPPPRGSRSLPAEPPPTDGDRTGPPPQGGPLRCPRRPRFAVPRRWRRGGRLPGPGEAETPPDLLVEVRRGSVAPPVGLEPTTLRLTVECSAS